MSLFDHIMRLTGNGAAVGDGIVEVDAALKLLKPGATVTLVEWNGCMAERRDEKGTGTIVRHEKSEGRYLGFIVRYPWGERWEPLQYTKFIGPEQRIEVWR